MKQSKKDGKKNEKKNSDGSGVLPIELQVGTQGGRHVLGVVKGRKCQCGCAD